MGLLLDSKPLVNKARMTDSPQAAVLVATYQRTEALRVMLESLAANPDVSRLAGVLVLENGMRSGSEQVVHEFSEVLPLRYQFVEEANKQAALNFGLVSCDAEFIIFFDDDIRIGPETIRTYLDAAANYGPGHFFGGPVDPLYENGPPPDWLRDVLPYSAKGFDLGNAECSSNEFLGANWGAFMTDVQAAGGFSLGLGPNARLRTIGGETELQSRFASCGLKGLYLPAARVEHFVPGENCTVGWARQRRTRQHLSRTLARNELYKGPTIGGVPRYMWRMIGTQGLKVLFDRAFRPQTPRRARTEMRFAELWGQAMGQRLLSQGVQIELA